jgi:hypothetical protein
MPKILEYPRAPLGRALALAEIVDRLGGECTDQSAAEAMGNKVGGSFNALVGGAIKYGFVARKSGKLTLEPLYQEYKLAYSDEEKQQALRKAFLSAPLFEAIAKRFEHMKLPAHFENLLIREHGVPSDMASRMVGYFEEGAKLTGILQQDGTINAWPKNITLTPETGLLQASASSTSSASAPLTPTPEPLPSGADFTVRITGPGMDSVVTIKDEDDIEIVNIMLKKVRKLFAAKDSQ